MLNDTLMQRRQISVDRARASVALEGLSLTPEIEAINVRFVAGEITRDEHIKLIKAAVRRSAGDGGTSAS